MEIFGWCFLASWIIAPLFLDWVDRLNESNGTDGVDEAGRDERGRGTDEGHGGRTTQGVTPSDTDGHHENKV